MKPKKSLGQHFLSDVRILGRIADAAGLAPGEIVIEIGPGEGGLTTQLLDRGARVVAVEKDARLAHELGGLGIRDSGLVKIVKGDALDLSWHSLLPIPNPESPIPPFAIVGNIPYYITSPLLDKALTPPLPKVIVFLVQKEVADRIAASPGSKTYGALSVGIQAACTVEKLFVVKAGAFRPPPKVDSAVIRLTPLAEPLVPVEQGRLFRRFVVACFGQRRKQLRNAVAGAVGREPSVVAAGLRSLGFDPTVRPEQLSPSDFARLLIWSRQL